MSEARITELLAPAFYPVHRDIRNGAHTHYYLSGGRGSGKSSFCSIELLLTLLRNPHSHAVVLRKVGATLRDSVFAQLVWAAEALGILQSLKITVSPMEIRVLPTGQKILFRGADDRAKLKSIKLPFGSVGAVWYEELDQFSSPEEIRSINQSLLRGENGAIVLYSFNPPKSRDHWVNGECAVPRPDRLCHHSTYLDVPRSWLGERFLSEAEMLKATKPQHYEHEYLGIATGSGGVVFDNLTVREITEEEISAMERFYYGIDFGFAVDPFVWIEMSYHRPTRTLFLLDEICEQRLKNEDAALRILQRRGVRRNANAVIFADSAEPKSIAQMRDFGLNIHPVKKGPDSVSAGIKWLQDLAEIVIDGARTPHALREFSCYEYAKNREGEFLSSYPDHANHTIDAARYGLSEVLSAGRWGVGDTKL